ncbi:hypothetical protein I552_8903 [Mycobacterium xenopi 3993]|nr:hypothetical protein I552_8903 [Mycobacterium xenopi 3993]
MAAVSGRGESRDWLPELETTLPIPQLLAKTLPGALPRGTVAVVSGARSLLLGMVAAVTAAGGNAAIVGQPDIGLLAAVEMGADLSRLAVIPIPDRSGGGRRGTHGRNGSGRPGPRWTVGVVDPGTGGNGPRPSERLHPAGHRRRLAWGVDAAGGPGLWLRNHLWRTWFRSDQQGAARREHTGARNQGADRVRWAVSSRVLAIWCMDWPAVAAAAAAGLPATARSRSPWPTG